MRFQHPDPRAERVVKAIPTRFDPKHHPNDGEVEKENNVRHTCVRERDGDDGGAAGDRPVGRNVEPLAPHHDPPHFAAIKMRHRIDVSRVVNAALKRDRRLLVRDGGDVFSCHDRSINWITGAESTKSSWLSPWPISSIPSKSRSTSEAAPRPRQCARLSVCWSRMERSTTPRGFSISFKSASERIRLTPPMAWHFRTPAPNWSIKLFSASAAAFREFLGPRK